MVKIRELFNQLNAYGEHDKIEAKTCTQVGKSILETVCAFANGPDLGGGHLLLGISKVESEGSSRYEVVGISNPENIIEDLVSQCRTSFNHPVQVKISQQTINGKVVIGVFVPEINNGYKPIYFKSRGLPKGAYIRMGSSDIKCSSEDLLQLILSQDTESYDAKIIPDADMSHIDLSMVEVYKKQRAEIHPNATELSWPNEELLQSLGCLKKTNDVYQPTVAGVLLFGTELAIRQFFPLTMRVDYIRQSGTTWISDPESRFTSVEIRAPLIIAIRKVISAIMDDLPKTFSLPEGALQRQDIPILPETTIREAVINAIMHRNYRVHQPIQIIRYANRIEIRNSGFSLISEEHLGEPGSKTRNPKVAHVLYEMRFAETKGSGIRIMRAEMKKAGLTPPVFESDRSRDLFVATFLFHHFLSKEDLSWLSFFKQYELSDAQAKALIFVRETGAIDNSAYRYLNHVDTHSASTSLTYLRDLNILTSKNQSSATYYEPGPLFLDSLTLSTKRKVTKLTEASEEQPKGHMVEPKGHMVEPKGHMVEPKGHMAEPKGHMAEGKGHMAEPEFSCSSLLLELPESLKQKVEALGKKASKEKMREAIVLLCNWQEMTAEELASLVRRDKSKLKRNYLLPMISEKLLEYTYPEMTKHPHQAYRAKKKS